MNKYRIAFVCAEKDPVVCHRALLVARAFFKKQIAVSHIHADGSLESHEQLENRLLMEWKLLNDDATDSREALVDQAYSLQGNKVAYQDKKMIVEHPDDEDTWHPKPSTSS